MMPDDHIVIGLTGNLGAGKSTVGRIAGDLGARVIDSDLTVRDLLANDPELAGSIRNAFGSEVMVGGRPDRAALARIVFNDSDALARLEELIYPRVGERTAELLAEPTTAPATIIEAIKVVEGPSVQRLDACGSWNRRLNSRSSERLPRVASGRPRRAADWPCNPAPMTRNACSGLDGADVRCGALITAPIWTHWNCASQQSGGKR